MGFSATSRRTRRTLACALLCTVVAAPTAALAARAPHSGSSGGNGGSGLGGGPTAGSPPITSGAPVIPTTGALGGAAVQVVRLSGVVNASGDGITLTVAASGIEGRPLTITGKAPTSDAGDSIAIESGKAAGGAAWTQAATAAIGANGAFTARWIPATSAQVSLRAVLAPGAAAGSGSGGTSGNGGSGLTGGGSASTASSEPRTGALTIPIFHDAVATMYGPGFWGHHTACGERLTRATLGVASRTLRCGTRVGIFYRGHEITVPVIDRGPFAKGVTWDLTMATAKALGIRETVTLGALAPAPAFTAHG